MDLVEKSVLVSYEATHHALYLSVSGLWAVFFLVGCLLVWVWVVWGRGIRGSTLGVLL